jgi:hypothetical protein
MDFFIIEIYMHIKRLITSPVGKIVISILLGIGLATMFRKACNDRNCIIFNGPVITDVEGKIYKHDNKCYKYTTESVRCDKTKQIIDIAAATDSKINSGSFFA